MTHGFFHTAITCKDPLSVERWYRKHFSFERARVYAPGPDQVVMVKANAVYLEIFKATLTQNSPRWVTMQRSSSGRST
jgi:hypothetical protein